MNRTIIKKLSYIGAAINQGQTLRGVEKGPDLIRNSGLFKHLQTNFGLKNIKDYGNIDFDGLSDLDKRRQPIQSKFINIHKLDPLLGTLNNKMIQAMDERQQNNLVLTVGGDHSIGSATIHGSMARNPNLKVIWVDAHPDFCNPEAKDSNTQNYHGSSLSHIAGAYKLSGFEWLTKNIPYQNIVLIGIREVQDNEFQLLRKNKVKCFSMDHIDKFGIGSVMTQALEYLDPKNQAPFHLSFDIDGMDPILAPHTGTKFKSGLNERQGCHIVRRIVNEKKLVSMDLVQINDEVHDKNAIAQKYRYEDHLRDDLSQTVKMGVDLISSLFERNINL